MGKLSRADYFRVVRAQYKKANKKTKGELLDAACQLTGLHRRVVARHLRTQPRRKRLRAKRPDIYSYETKQTVMKLWHAANDIAAARLHPFIPDLLDKLKQFGLVVSPEAETQLRHISLATVKRILKGEKRRSTIRIGGTTKPGSLLKRQIPTPGQRGTASSPE